MLGMRVGYHTDHTDIKRIMRYCEQLYVNKLKNFKWTNYSKDTNYQYDSRGNRKYEQAYAY